MAARLPSGAPPRPPISTHLQLVSPRQAREILEDNPFPRQRKVRPYQVAFLKQIIEDGHLRPGTLVSFAVFSSGKRWLINGQHTLMALGQTSGGPLWFQIEEIKCANEERAGELYETYDRNLQRSWADLYRADPSLLEVELAPKHLYALGGATHHISHGFQGLGYRERTFWGTLLRDARRRFALMGSWHLEMLNFVSGCQGPTSVRHLLMRSSVLGVALVTHRFQRDAAHSFWPRLAADSGLEAGEPAHTLLRWLRETPARKLDPASYARYVAAAWNCAFEGRDMPSMRARGAAQPILILGTPHLGNRHCGFVTRQGEILETPQPYETEETD